MARTKTKRTHRRWGGGSGIRQFALLSIGIFRFVTISVEIQGIELGSVSGRPGIVFFVTELVALGSKRLVFNWLRYQGLRDLRLRQLWFGRLWCLIDINVKVDVGIKLRVGHDVIVVSCHCIVRRVGCRCTAIPIAANRSKQMTADARLGFPSVQLSWLCLHGVGVPHSQ